MQNWTKKFKIWKPSLLKLLSFCRIPLYTKTCFLSWSNEYMYHEDFYKYHRNFHLTQSNGSILNSVERKKPINPKRSKSVKSTSGILEIYSSCFHLVIILRKIVIYIIKAIISNQTGIAERSWQQCPKTK